MKNITKRIIVFGLVLGAINLIFPISKANALWKFDSQGNLIQVGMNQGAVLGDEDKKEEDKQKEEDKKDEKVEKKEDEKKTEEQNIQKQEEKKEDEKKSGESEKVKSTIKKEDIEKIEIHSTDKSSESESENEVESENEASDEGKMEVKIKKFNKEEFSEKQESFEMETEDGGKIHIEMSPEKTQIEFKMNGVSAAVDLPLSLNIDLKKLMLSTIDGDIVIESLPDEVLNKLKKDKKIEEKSKVQLEVKYENGQIVYKVDEKKSEKFAGVLPVDLTKKINVEDGTGNILSTQETFLNRILDLFSF